MEIFGCHGLFNDSCHEFSQQSGVNVSHSAIISDATNTEQDEESV